MPHTVGLHSRSCRTRMAEVPYLTLHEVLAKSAGGPHTVLRCAIQTRNTIIYIAEATTSNSFAALFRLCTLRTAGNVCRCISSALKIFLQLSADSRNPQPTNFAHRSEFGSCKKDGPNHSPRNNFTLMRTIYASNTSAVYVTTPSRDIMFIMLSVNKSARHIFLQYRILASQGRVRTHFSKATTSATSSVCRTLPTHADQPKYVFSNKCPRHQAFRLPVHVFPNPLFVLHRCHGT
jgi:hypothetical protein